VTVDTAALTDEELMAQLAPLLKEYAARVLEQLPGPLPGARWATRLNATESALVAVDLLRAAEITSFELAAMFNI
jgi:hypothetical protein